MRSQIVVLLVAVAGCGPAQQLDTGANGLVTLATGNGPWSAPVGSRSGPLLAVGNSFLALNPEHSRVLLGDLQTLMLTSAYTLEPGSEAEVASCSSASLTCWVALRGVGQVVQFDVRQGLLKLVQRYQVGSEPTGIAVSPNGRYVVVATFSEHSVAVIDADTGAVGHVDVGGQPRAVGFSNADHASDGEQRAWVSLFFGQGSPGQRQGVVVAVDPVALNVADSISFSTGQGCEPNQLSAVAEAQGALYVAFQCVVPGATSAVGTFDTGLAVVNTATRQATSYTLRQLLNRAVPDPVTLLVRAAPSGQHNLVVLTRGSGLLTQLLLTPTDPLSLPTGVVLEPCAAQAAPPSPYGPTSASNCWGSGPAGGALAFNTGLSGQFTGFAVGPNGEELVYDRFDHSVLRSVTSTAGYIRVGLDRQPPTAAELKELEGRFHFNSSRGEWASAGDPVSCSSCHPDGLSDGLTWKMSTGPRQTIALDGAFTKGNPADHRAHGWGATGDEVADVEGLVRSFMGGVGALTSGGTPISLQLGVAVGNDPPSRHDGLSGSAMELSRRLSSNHDWEPLEFWLQHVRTPRAPTLLDGARVAHGRQVFAAAGCHTCHGGPRWTVSRVPYTPSASKNGSDRSALGMDPTVPFGLRVQARTGGTLPFAGPVNTDTLEVDVEHLPLPDGGSLAQGPERITCVLRDVGTFDALDPAEVTPGGTPALGSLGFNVPSLLGAGTSAPYLHHGAAATLEDLLSSRYQRHLSVGNPAFAPEPGGTDLKDLAAFVASIDERTEPMRVPAGYDVCGGY